MDWANYLGRLLKKTFALDLRSLAVFRIGLGLLILCDLVMRSADLVAFYTDRGILPRQLVLGGLALEWHWSLHLVNGTTGFAGMMFVLAGVVAVLLAVGYRTQLMTLVSWLLLVSLHSRNPLVLNAGDTYLGMLAFWGIFLPLGKVWSVDAMRQPNAADQRQLVSGFSVTSLATFALYTQIAMMYMGAGMLKRAHEAWQSGEAIRLALVKDFIVTRFGQSLVEYPDFLKSLSQVTMVFELLGPLALLISRGWLRVVVVAAFVGFHIGLAACFTIGLFSYVCIVAFAAFLPAVFWNRLLKQSPPQTEFVGKDNESLERIPLCHYAKQGVLVLALTIAVWTSLSSVSDKVTVPPVLRNLGTAFRWNQKWQMFVNVTGSKNGWFVFHAQFADGKSVDLLTGKSPVSYDKPDLVSATFKNFRWRKFCINLRDEKYQLVRTYLGEYLLLERDRTDHDVHQLVGLELNFLSPAEKSGGDGEAHSVAAFNRQFPTAISLDKEVLYQWQNEARKYQDAFIFE